MLIVSEWKQNSPLLLVSASYLNIRVCSLCHFLPIDPFKMLPFGPLRKLRTCENAQRFEPCLTLTGSNLDNLLRCAFKWKEDLTSLGCWLGFGANCSWNCFPRQKPHQYSSHCGRIRRQNTAFFFSLPTLIPALLLVPGEVDNKPNSLEIVNRATQGWSPWAACGGDHVLDKHLQLPHFLHALLLEQISSALGCEINIMAEVWNEASSTCWSLEESASE